MVSAVGDRQLEAGEVSAREERPGLEQVQEQARQAAAEGAARPDAGAGPRLLAPLPELERFLKQAVEHFRGAAAQESLSYAAEWMLDNFFLVQQALRQIGHDMPKGYYRQLPRLISGPLAGYPRVYDVARRLVISSGARLDLEAARQFVLAYQDVMPLTTGELWALPVMLRLSLLDALAEALAQITGLSRPARLPGLELSPVLTGDEIVANSFTSLRTLATHDWKRFFEHVSRVEQTLRRDPAGIYASMEPETRDRYRKVVEELALATGESEVGVALAAVNLAMASGEGWSAGGGDQRDSITEKASVPDDTWAGLEAPVTAHVGYYLLDEGRALLEAGLSYRPSVLARLGRWARAHPTVVYLSPIFALVALLLAAAVAYGNFNGASAGAQLLILLLVLVPAITVAVAVVDWLVTLVVPPRVLPKLDLEAGIPASCRTLIVVPALIGTGDDVDSLLRQLELHYLRNRDANLWFGLLTDYPDHSDESAPDDAALLAHLRVGVEGLNARYATDGEARFCLFHRARRCNPSETCWMGWERKRGKLHELNRWLRGATDTSFIVTDGPADLLRSVRYVITLDADTVLGRDSARRLVGTLAHPLNRAVFDPVSRTVIKGYGLLQPRAEITPSSANYSRFSRIFAGDIGLDLYTHAVSNVYQDLFGSGIYVGKGIYDIDIFERSLADRVPDNTLLSHDLFEGIHARVGLVTDIVLYEDYPPSYLAHIGRLHRWTRGDWQLLPWLLPGLQRSRLPHAFRGIELWKPLDNLRRSLLAPSLVLLLAAAWLGLPGGALMWTLVALAALAVPVLLSGLTPLLSGADSGSFQKASRALRDGGLRWLLAIVFLPYEAAQMVMAITTSVIRVLITRRQLLQWTTAAEAARRLGVNGSRRRFWSAMGQSPLVAAVIAALVAWVYPGNLAVGAPLLLAWVLAPEIAYFISQPVRTKPEYLSDEQLIYLRSLARRTWLFFERFVGPDDHWLPPDHYQENPRGVVSPYTSPTNIGMLLLSTLAAYDLGYIGVASFVTRLESTFETLSRLERYRGHFLNWYDTRTLEPLPPRYVSTVDSGNLAACLLVLRQSCLAIPPAPLLRWQRWEALVDTFNLFRDVIRRLETAKLSAQAAQLQALLSAVETYVQQAEAKPTGWMTALDYIAGDVWTDLKALLSGLIEEQGKQLGEEMLREIRIVIERTEYQLFTLHRYVNLLLPWLPMLQAPPGLLAAGPAPAALAAPWQALAEAVTGNPVLGDLPGICDRGQKALARLEEALAALSGTRDEDEIWEARAWCQSLSDKMKGAAALSKDLLEGLDRLADLCETYFQAMNFRFLFDTQRQVFHIGYNVSADKLDDNYYDLLASEARIASLVALAKHEVPHTHWLHLARPLTQVDGTRALLSWSATMFEYLMPSLFLPSYEGTLLYESEVAAVDHQINYGRRKKTPWGISESGYYAFDAHQNYQYRAFGVPGLGFKRNLADDLVIAPYASLLALPYRPKAVVANLTLLEELGALGTHGLYEAIDFTRARLPLSKDHALVAEYMAHHQGMILVALANYLQDGQMRQRFLADPRAQSVDLLLQERIPIDAPLEFPQPGQAAPLHRGEPPAVVLPWNVPVASPVPLVHYLSNGRYGVLLSNAGGGFSRWGELDLTRWRADATLEDWGTWIYLLDRDDGTLWSATTLPTSHDTAGQEVRYHAHMAEYHRSLHDIAVTTEVTVAAEDVEIRLITLLNRSERPRRLAVTSYGEVVMAPSQADARHPAFNKLFIESEYLPEQDALLFRRRPRSQTEAPVFVAHMAVSGSGESLLGSHETDRARFLGRFGRLRDPAALMDPAGQLSGTTGATLDPIMALQCEVSLEPAQTVRLAFVTSAAASREALLQLVNRYRPWLAIEDAFNQASSRAEAELTQLGLSSIELERMQRLLSVLVYPYSGLRAEAATLAANVKGQPGLWAFGISGDYPILLLRVSDEEDLTLVHDLLQAHAYWRRRLLKIDLVLLMERAAGYSQELRDQIHRLLVRQHCETWLNQRGGIFLLTAGQLADADRVLLETAARVVLNPAQGSLAAQLEIMGRVPAYLPSFAPEPADALEQPPIPPVPRPAGLRFDNGLGGFSTDGSEYIIYLESGAVTPAPWINVIANPDFGFLASESGLGYTWAINSGENRLSPWSNDPVTDPAGEAVYLRDEETGEFWSPTPQPCPAPAPYLVRHGAGYTRYEHHSHGLVQALQVFVPPDAPVKILHLRVENKWGTVRRITVTYYVEWVLGVGREDAQQYVVPEYDAGSQALLARNPYNPEFGERVAFVAASERLHGLTANRTEFLGRLGSRSAPAALKRIGLGTTVRAGLDPCAALQVHLDLDPGEAKELWFVLGQATDRQEAVGLATDYKEAAAVERARQAVTEFWDGLLGAVQVETPDEAMDLLLNRWLLYQALACRIWGRSAFYQSSGAFGFRDQLQDVMATIHAAPGIARTQILLAARHQFEAGDVLHWWHPPSGRGVRTRCSDDLLWLPFVTAHYIEATGDESVLDEELPFLRGTPLEADEEERYGLFMVTSESYSLYEHCRRAIERGTTAGAHGLPLMGSGDWNDGMNRVGIQGRGESVWLGWFLHATLTRFAAICERKNDEVLAFTLRDRAAVLAEHLEERAWDGNWYLRAFYDDGTPLGSAQNEECQIDAIAQSWAVLSGAGDPARAVQAMTEVRQRLVRPAESLILLFTPPFDKTPQDPGYIKGYLPGIRENGGQYTHAALWTVWAFAELGDGEAAHELFSLLNPINHAATLAEAGRYKVEPYVVAADVYGVPPHTGRGGWTWYTGSAGWMYRLGLEGILGVQRAGNRLCLARPKVPAAWPGFTITYRYGRSRYRIQVKRTDDGRDGAVTLDGHPLPGPEIPLEDDDTVHEVVAWLGLEGLGKHA